jgi:DNA-binding GntR family transcriptional regulator
MMVGVMGSRKTGTQVRPSLVDDAYAALKLAIRESEFPPGHHLSEQEIALRLGMSRTPIHEATLRLQEEGLLRILPRRGIQIASVSPSDLAEILEVFIAIEAAAAERLAALPGCDRRRIAMALDAETDAMEKALAEGDLVARGRADDQFHRLLVESCGNSRFVRIMQMLGDQAHRARVLTVKLRPNLALSVSEHRDISDAIKAGDAPAAREHSRHHRIRARNEIVPLLESIGLRHL